MLSFKKDKYFKWKKEYIKFKKNEEKNRKRNEQKDQSPIQNSKKKNNKLKIFITIILIIMALFIIFMPITLKSISKDEHEKQIEKFKSEVTEFKNVKKDGFNGYYNNIGEMIGFIKIDKIGLNLPIYEGVEEKVLQNGAGHLKETLLPKKEGNFHTFLAGHTGIISKKLFDDLPKIKKGDYFDVTIFDDEFKFKVFEIKKINPNQAYTESLIKDNGRFATLVTCVPKFVNTHRLLITGELQDTPIKMLQFTGLN